MNYVEGCDRHQMMMMTWDQMVHEQSFARIIDAFADALDLSGLGFANAKLNPEGRPPFKPADLLKLYLYGYHQNIRSCRKLENACQVNIEVIWLMKGMQPHYKTIANFRKDNAKALRQVFRQFVAILKDWKLVSGKHIAVDSFKIRAQNSLKNNSPRWTLYVYESYLLLCLCAA
jgi:transposase